MKIFISYGHNDHTPLVDALFDALLRDGHAPWKDDRYEGASGIPAGEDFTKVIYDAIDDSDCVLAFVTAKTLEKPYCCDERQYAYNHKGSKFIQLRLDGADIRLGNAFSYVDMEAAEDSAGKVNAGVLESKLQTIYAAFRDPAALLGPSAKFERHLKTAGAVQYEEFITMPEQDDFVGRQWLKETCVRWVMDDTIPCRLFVILGEAGTGKTAFVRHLASDKELVRSVHICVYDRPVTRNVRDTLKDLSYTLTTTNPAYHNYLKNKDFSQLEEMDYDGLFEFLFVEPLKNEQEKYLLIIDGLDELEETTGLKPLMQLLRQYANKLNPNISILVTGRPEESIVSKLKTVNTAHAQQSVVLGKENGREDLARYIQKNLEELGCDPSLAGCILDACDGNFEYLTLLFKEAKEEGLELSGGMALPKGLGERYTQYLDRRMEKSKRDEELTKEQKVLLALLCVAYEPMPMSLLAKITDYDEEDVEDELKVFGTLLRRVKTPDGEVLVSFFSTGFRDYLLSGEFENYKVSAKRGTRQIAEYILENCKTETALQKVPYFDRHGFTHLLLYMEKEQEAVTAYLDAMTEADSDRTVLRIVNALCAGEENVVQVYFAQKHKLHRQAINRLKGRREIGILMQISDLQESRGDRFSALTLRADVERMNPSPEAYERAEKLYRQTLALAEENHRKEPCYDTRCDLSLVYERLADMIGLKGTKEAMEEAELWHRRELEMVEQNYRENPCYASRRSLAITYERLGDMAAARGTKEDKEEAEQWYRKELELAEQNYRENPCYASRRSLAITYERLGDVVKGKGTKESKVEAEQWYRKKLEQVEQNYRENPSYATRRSLAIVYERLGSIADAKGTKEGKAEAEQWYRKDLELTEQNYRENPCYQSRRSLAITYERLGDLAAAKGTKESRAEAEQWHRKKLEQAEQNHRENPCYESRRSLAITYERLGDLADAKGTEESRAEAEQWFRKELELIEQNYREDPSYASRRSLAVVYERLGDIANGKGTEESKAEAEQWFRKELELTEQNYRENPSYATRRSLAIVYERLGDIAEAKGTEESKAEAERWFRKELELTEQNYRENPCYQSRRSLLITCERLGDLAEAKGTGESKAEAEQWYRKELALAEQNYRENPCYQSRRSLVVAYERLGDMAKNSRERMAEAENWYWKKLALAEESYRENPDWKNCRSLAVSYYKMADAVGHRGTFAGWLEAKMWYEKSEALFEKLHEGNPNDENRKLLEIVRRDINRHKVNYRMTAKHNAWVKNGTDILAQILYKHDNRGVYVTEQDTAFGGLAHIQLVVEPHDFTLSVGDETLRKTACDAYAVTVTPEGEAVFYDAKSRMIAKADKGDGVYRAVQLHWEPGILSIRFGGVEVIDNYPNCDGESDRWDEKWITRRTVTLYLANGTLKVQ